MRPTDGVVIVGHAIPDQVNSEKLAEVALAVLSLTMFNDHGAMRAWKGLDWDLLAFLHEKRWILDPKDKAKSVVLTEEGQRLALAAFEKHSSRSAVDIPTITRGGASA